MADTERPGLLFETCVHIEYITRHAMVATVGPSPAVRSLLKQRLHKLKSCWSCSKPTSVKRSDRLVQISDPSCARSAKSVSV